MASLNQIQLIGNATKDAKSGKTNNGKAWARFTLAVQRWAPAGQRSDKADFFGVVCWGKWAEAAAVQVRKGSPVAVFGSMEINEWEKDGVPQRSPEVNALTLCFIKNRAEQENDAAEHGVGDQREREDRTRERLGGGGSEVEEPLPAFDD